MADKEISHEFSVQDKRYYIDLYSSNPGIYNVVITLGNDVNVARKVVFAPNCKTEMIHCMLKPRQGLWYINAILGDKRRQLLNGE